MPTLPRTVKYAGLLTVPIRVGTTTFPAKNGAWDFNPGSPIPMEFHGYVQAQNPVGFFARVIDLNTGYTTLAVGDTTNAHENTPLFCQPVWNANRVTGWCFASVLTLTMVAYDYALAVDGAAHVLPTFNPRSVVLLPMNVNNTGAPQTGNAPNNITPTGGAAASAIISLVEQNYVEIAGSQSGPFNTFNFGISNQHHINQASRVSAGSSWVTCANPSDNTDRLQLVQTDFLSFAQNYSVTYENPPGGADIDDLMTQHANVQRTFPTGMGFLCICKDIIVVDGVTLNGFGVLIAPDYSTYQLVNLPPSDAGTAAWWTTVGEFTGRVDLSGALWMKNANSSTILFVSAGSVLRVLPIFFPVPIPDRAETDPVASMMRSYQQ